MRTIIYLYTLVNYFLLHTTLEEHLYTSLVVRQANCLSVPTLCRISPLPENHINAQLCMVYPVPPYVPYHSLGYKFQQMALGSTTPRR